MSEKDKGQKITLSGSGVGETFSISVAFYEEVAKALKDNDNDIKKVIKEYKWLRPVVQAVYHREQQKRRALQERGLLPPDEASGPTDTSEDTASDTDTPDSEE